MDISMADAANLILNLFLEPAGYWPDEISEDPVVYKFAKENLISLDEEYGEKYVINNAGRDVLYPYIERFSREFISFMERDNKPCPISDIANWYFETYELDDSESGAELAEYICFNLPAYGYRAIKSYKTEEKYRYEIQKLPAQVD